MDTTLSVQTNGAESVFHLRIGPRRAVEVVRVADKFYVEVDQQGGLAGFWLTNVPPFTASKRSVTQAASSRLSSKKSLSSAVGYQRGVVALRAPTARREFPPLKSPRP